MLNPNKQTERLTNPIERSNPVNDPDYAHQEGYNPFSLSAPTCLTARFGEVTPFSFTETVPGDRHLEEQQMMSFMDQVDGRILSDIRCFVDYFHVSLRNIFPINYDKIIVNPVKGDDIPFAAHPQIPLMHTLYHFMSNSAVVSLRFTDTDDTDEFSSVTLSQPLPSDSFSKSIIDTCRCLYLAYILSRGQLLDMIGFCPDIVGTNSELRKSAYKRYRNKLQDAVDNYFRDLFAYISYDDEIKYDRPLAIYGVDLSATDDGLNTDSINITTADLDSEPALSVKVCYEPNLMLDNYGMITSDFDLSAFRGALYDCFEKGLFIVLRSPDFSVDGILDRKLLQYAPSNANVAFWNSVKMIFSSYDSLPSDSVTDYDSYFDSGFINPSRLVAYQQVIAQYHTNDHVDNVFNSELWMQNVRAIMYPSITNLTYEPTFKYNGVDTEYDLFTTGGFRRAFFDEANTYGLLPRFLAFFSNVFIIRRSLRYKDYFASGRPNMLAVGDLKIPLGQDGVSVSPVDVTKGIVLQRFFNAVNRWGMKAINYMASLFGVKPSNTGCVPSYVAQIPVSITGDTVANTSSNQGKVTTNLVASSKQFAFDIFVDDFGILLGLLSFDTPAYYPSGISRHLRNGDRFSLFNPMLQNVGDQAIRVDEITGELGTSTAIVPFAYSTRYAEYKNAIARCHGGFVNDLPAYTFVYPWRVFISDGNSRFKISPDFIRDAPYYMDRYRQSLTGVSPAQYYHFTCKFNSKHDSARKMEFWPAIL